MKGVGLAGSASVSAATAVASPCSRLFGLLFNPDLFFDILEQLQDLNARGAIASAADLYFEASRVLDAGCPYIFFSMYTHIPHTYIYIYIRGKGTVLPRRAPQTLGSNLRSNLKSPKPRTFRILGGFRAP